MIFYTYTSGYEIYDVVGQHISWEEGASLTTLTVPGETGQNHEIVTDSFFHFFDPKEWIERTNPTLKDELLDHDLEIG